MNTSKKISGFRKRLLGFKTTFVFMALVVLFFGAALPVLALDTGVQYGTASGLGTQDLRITIMKIIRIFLGFVGVIAIVINVYAGYLWMASAGNAEQIDKAKRILRNAVIGLVIIFSAFGIVSFIISALEGATNVGQTPGGGPPAGACDNCGHLGNGIIESVYPIPFAKNVARNTSIMVTFKVAMKPETIVKGCTALPCADKELVSNNVRIYENNKPEASRLGDGDVLASSTDGKTFVFKPKNYLGDGTNNIWYAVKLTSGIQKGNGESAFPGAAGYFTWRFEVGTFLDLDPVEAGNVFPEPDNQADNYTTAAAGQAAGKIKVLAANFPPRVNQAASVAVVKLGGTTADAASTGTYNSDFSGQIKVTVNSSSLTANVFWANNNPNNKTNAPITSDNINLGGGLTLRLGSGYAAGNQWGLNVIPNQSADTLAVDNKLYTFALTPPALTVNQIERGTDAADQAQKIAAKINADNLSVTATATGAEVSLQAKMAGKTGNIISLSASGNWASLCNIDATPVCDASRITLSGGVDAVFTATKRSAADKPRNATIAIDFNEAISPAQVNKDTIIIEYSTDPNGVGGWTPVNGVYLISNQYKTVEFLSGVPCDNGAGGTVTNSCGDKIYCLPTNDTNPYRPTHYRVTVKAGLLKECTATDCTDPNFKVCIPTAGGNGSACQGDAGGTTGVFYPEVRSAPAGIIDAAANSFNGNENTYTLNSRIFGQAEGPQTQSGQPPYELNKVCSNNHTNYCLNDSDCGAGNTCLRLSDEQGDDLIWSFYINRSLDLSPSVIKAVGPVIGGNGTSLTAPVDSAFNEVMMSASLKPGSNYQDGYCQCATNDDCNYDTTGQICENFRCKNQSGDQLFCLENKECKNNGVCHNRKYISLIDKATQPVGWWASKVDLDIVLPKDGYADETMVELNHTKFLEVTNYGLELGSGIKDIYQNCYLPSGGPKGNSADNHCNITTATACSGDNECPTGERCISVCNPGDPNCCQGSPYCCNGQPMDVAAWEASPCYTGY